MAEEFDFLTDFSKRMAAEIDLIASEYGKSPAEIREVAVKVLSGEMPMMQDEGKE